MSASDTNAEILGSLGRGDAVAAVEAAKDAAYALAQAIEAQADEQSAEQVFNRADEPAEELLAVLYPLIEHGSERATEALPRVLLHVAQRTSAALQETSAHRVGGTIVLGRLVWATVAYAIHCGRFDAIAEASRATVRVPFTDDVVTPVIALQTLRYPDALGGNAGNSYENYRDWLHARPLITSRYPLFAGEAEEAIAEADLLLALLLAQQRGRVYSRGHDRNTVPRLARRLRDGKHQQALAALFHTTEAHLETTLESAYSRLETDQRRWENPPASLFNGGD
jgi:hypothetical protein